MGSHPNAICSYRVSPADRRTRTDRRKTQEQTNVSCYPRQSHSRSRDQPPDGAELLHPPPATRPWLPMPGPLHRPKSSHGPPSSPVGRFIVPEALSTHRLRRWAATSSQKLSCPTDFAGGPLHRPRSSLGPPSWPVSRFIVPEALSVHRLGRCAAS